MSRLGSHGFFRGLGTRIEHEAIQAIRHDHPTITREELPAMPQTLADAIHAEVQAAIDDILARYLTPANLAHALSDALNAPPPVPAPSLPPLPPPPPADVPQPGDADQQPA